MENSAQSENVLALGRKLVGQLGLDDSNDTLGRWMAHYLADLIKRAEVATGPDKEIAQEKCYAAILTLWRHRTELPNGKRPYEELEPVIRAIESLDPEDTTPRYYRAPRPPGGKAAETSEQEKWLRVVDGLDYTAKVLIGYCLAEAAGSALDKSKDWVELAEGVANDGVPEVVIRVISDAAELNEARDLNGPARRLLADKIKRLDGFVQLAETVSQTLSKRLCKADWLFAINSSDPQHSETDWELSSKQSLWGLRTPTPMIRFGRAPFVLKSRVSPASLLYETSLSFFPCRVTRESPSRVI